MDNLLPPLLILLAVAAIVVIAARASAKRSRASADRALGAGPQAAAAASSRLTGDQHRAVYSLIARGLTAQAIVAYREATGAGLLEARNAVLLLSRFPQAPQASGSEDAAPTGRAPSKDEPEGRESHEVTAAAEPSPGVVRGEGTERAPQRFPYRYRAIVSNGRETFEVASNMLNDEIYNEIKGLAHIGDTEDAAQLLRRHADITIEDARAFVALL